VMYIHTSAEFILTSFAIAKDGVKPDAGIVDMARMWNVYMSSSLQLVDNLLVLCTVCDTSFVDIIACRYSLYVHWAHTIKMWKLVGSASQFALPSLRSCYAHLRGLFYFIIYQHRSPRRASLTSSGPSVRNMFSRSSSTPRSSPYRPTFRPATPRCSSTRPKSLSTLRARA
jgi:hypothetical protein